MHPPARRTTVFAALVLALALYNGAAPVHIAGATFPGKNGRITFENYVGGDQPEIYIANADGTGATNLTNNPAEDITPAWSPDGRNIVFASDRMTQGSRFLYLMDADGGNVTQLTHEGGDFWPVWSPDGSQILFRSDGRLMLVPASGGQPVQLSTPQGTSTEPDFSPDGSRIVFGNNNDGDFEIWVMDADGSNPMQLTDNTVSDENPSWSPDGSKIAYSSRISGNTEVWVMNPDGNEKTNITDDPADDGDPVWSPDGSLIGYYSDRSPAGFYTMTPDGSNQHLMIAADAFSLDWESIAPALIQGDINCDNNIDGHDTLAVLAHSSGLAPHQEPGCPEIGGSVAVTVVSTRFGDVDCSGDVTPRDGLMIILHSAGLPATPEHQPCTSIGDSLHSFGLPPLE